MQNKITMKIEDDAHKKLRIVQGLLGAKSLSDTIKILSEDCIEAHFTKKKR